MLTISFRCGQRLLKKPPLAPTSSEDVEPRRLGEKLKAIAAGKSSRAKSNLTQSKPLPPPEVLWLDKNQHTDSDSEIGEQYITDSEIEEQYFPDSDSDRSIYSYTRTRP